MNVYFEKLTLVNWWPACLSLLKGHQVYYFELGGVFRRIPPLTRLMTKWFERVQYGASESQCMTLEINEVALEAAESLHELIVEENALVFGLWQRTFHSERVHLYVKKLVAGEALSLVRGFLLLRQRAKQVDSRTRLVALDNSLNRLLLPFLQKRFPDPGIEITGLSRLPWRTVHNLASMTLSMGHLFAGLLSSIGRRGFALRRRVNHFKVSKEIIGGIGILRKGDDFVVDGRRILADDLLLYYRRSSAARMSQPEFLPTSIANAKALGYKCVNFDSNAIPVAWLWQVVLPRYILFPILVSLMAAVKLRRGPSASLLNHLVTAFVGQAREWEFFLACHRPSLNLSIDDPHASHIPETVALNLHGCKNGGFQWSDNATYRDVTLAYVGFNVYFAWGPLAQKFWAGNWAVDLVVYVGYLWSHYYRESLERRDELRRKLLGDGQDRKLVVSLLDEKPSPVTQVTDQALYDFYRIGTDLLARRSDTVVIAKPKRFEGVPEVPQVLELIAPDLELGRMKLWAKGSVDAQELIAISDVVVSLEMGVPYLEAACCGHTGFNFAPSRGYSSPITEAGYGKVIFDNVGDLLEAIERALDHPGENPWEGLAELLDDVDPHRDFQGIERMRRFIYELAGESAQQPQEEVVAVGARD